MTELCNEHVEVRNREENNREVWKQKPWTDNHPEYDDT